MRGVSDSPSASRTQSSAKNVLIRSSMGCAGSESFSRSPLGSRLWNAFRSATPISSSARTVPSSTYTSAIVLAFMARVTTTASAEAAAQIRSPHISRHTAGQYT